MARDDHSLFSDGDLHSVLRAQEEKAVREVDSYDGNRLLNTPSDDLCNYFIERHRIEHLVLADDSQISVDSREATLDTRRTHGGGWNYGDHQPTVPATAYSYHVPFSGEADLFKLRPSSYTLSPPRGTVSGADLVLTFTVPASETASLKSEFNNQLNQIRAYVNNIKSSVDDFNNNGLPRGIRRAIDERKGRLLKAQDVATSLGYPMRRREGMPTTYAAPSVRRKITPSPPAASSAPYKPEPTLANDEYEHILSVMQSMALVLERSPSAFKTMGEEAERSPRFPLWFRRAA